MVILGPGGLGDHQVQVGRQLVELVHGADEHAARVLVHDQVVEPLRALVRERLDQDVISDGRVVQQEQRAERHQHRHRSHRSRHSASKFKSIQYTAT